MTLESAGATGSGPGIKQVTAPISPQDTATLKVDVKPGQLLGARRRRRHPRRAAAGRRPSARARRTTCCNRRPSAGASDTIGACRYGLLRRCCASASCSAPAPSRRRPPAAEPAGALPRRAAQGRRARRAASSACCARTPASSRRRRVFADLTGDGKSDAVVTVENGGAAGAVAAYVLTAEGSDSGALRVAFRNQSLYQGHVRMSGPTVTVVRPDLRPRRRRLLPAPRHRARLRVGREPRRRSRGARRGR